MKCHFCSRTATIHFTDIIQGQQHKMHLCQECASDYQIFPSADGGVDPDAVAEFVFSHGGGQQFRSPRDLIPELICPECGVPYDVFRTKGRLGCPHDYVAFKDYLGPLMEHIHHGATHVGKRPEARADAPDPLHELRRQLDIAIHEERYEDAARIRDLIRQREGNQ
jgi:protein arginine kinase activator